MLKKIIYGVINTISILVIAAAVAVLCMVLMTKPGNAPEILGYTVLRVTTGSMEPTYPVDTLLVVHRTDPSQIREGDIISFYSADPSLNGAINTHRVTGIRKEEDHWIYTTKGDANNVEDSYEAEDSALLGKVVAASVALGKLSRLTANPLIFIPVILVPLAIILVSNLIHTISLAGRIAREEEERAVKEAVKNIREKRQQEEEQQREKKTEADPGEKDSRERS